MMLPSNEYICILRGFFTVEDTNSFEPIGKMLERNKTSIAYKLDFKYCGNNFPFSFFDMKKFDTFHPYDFLHEYLQKHFKLGLDRQYCEPLRVSSFNFITSTNSLYGSEAFEVFKTTNKSVEYDFNSFKTEFDNLMQVFYNEKTRVEI